MLEIILTIGIPASSKSTWAKEKIKDAPNDWVRINNDDIRQMCNGSVWSKDYEKIVAETREFLIRTALKHDKNVICDNLNIGNKNWEITCKIAKEMNKDIIVSEKLFYIELEEAIARDSKREGSACVGAPVIKHWWNKSGKEKFKDYQVKSETFLKRTVAAERFVKPMEQDENLSKCAIFDLDGTMCNIAHRNPYDASRCIDDSPIKYVVDLSKLLYKNEYKIFFFSGREDKHREMTQKWLNIHFGEKYELYMRETNNKEDDRILKERLFNTYIKDKFYCALWTDDRKRVCEYVFSAGLPLMRVGDPNASF